MTIKIDKQLQPALAPLPGVIRSAGAHDSLAGSNGTPQLHARFPRREMQQTMRFTRGEVLFPSSEASTLDTGSHDYIVTEGELLFLQDGLPVDLIEAGEWFTAWLWDGAQVVAHTDCAIRTVESRSAPTRTKVPAKQPHASPAERMSDFLAQLAHVLTEQPTCQSV